jgi:hypothetical protein
MDSKQQEPVKLLYSNDISKGEITTVTDCKIELHIRIIQKYQKLLELETAFSFLEKERNRFLSQKNIELEREISILSKKVLELETNYF